MGTIVELTGNGDTMAEERAQESKVEIGIEGIGQRGQGLHQPGDLIRQRYQIISVLGRGSTGVTYRALDLQTQDQIALKTLSLRQTGDWKIIELFEREATTLAKLQHPQIPTYLDYFVEDLDTGADRRFYIAQTMAEGKSLAQWVESGWRANEKEVKVIARQVLQILSYLQTLNPPVIHRDIKPENLIRRPDGQIFLVDFGAVAQTYHNTMSRGSTVVGTMGYMAPEQFRGQAFPATDFYGLAATLLFLLTQRSPAELPTRGLKLEFRSRLQISDSLTHWLEQALEPIAKDRFASAPEALAQLNRVTFRRMVSPRRWLPLSAIALLAVGGFWLYGHRRHWVGNQLGFTNTSFSGLGTTAKPLEPFVYDYINTGGDPNMREANGETLVFRTIHANNLELTKLLVGRGASLDIVNNNGQTPVYVVARFYNPSDPKEVNVEMIRYVLSFKTVNLMAKDKGGKTFVEHVRSEPMAMFLFKYLETANLAKADKEALQNSLLRLATQKNWQILIALYSNSQANSLTVLQTTLDRIIPSGSSAGELDRPIDQMIARQHKLSADFLDKYNFYDILRHISAQKILQVLPNINAVDASGSTLLNYIASTIGSEEDVAFLQKLIRSGANVNLPAKSKNTPLLNALLNVNGDDKYRETAAITLINEGAKINVAITSSGSLASQDLGNTPLHIAVERYSDRLINLLLNKGADPKIKNSAGSTALELAVSNKQNAQVLERLLTAEADLDSKFDQGSQPSTYGRICQMQGEALLFRAACDGNLVLVRLLIRRGANLNIQKPNGDTPLHAVVAESNNPQIAQALLAAGANPNARNRINYGETPLDKAVEDYLYAKQNARDQDGDLSNRRATMQALITGGADPRATVHNRSSPLEIWRKHQALAPELKVILDP